ncbi:unnamed protein product [Durusdinium trenchii]|uniref:Uncharacterized protein n=1 Tax=Durusdinium trenchii TaxID=1381693 RepID=A0ABP0SEQ0_9DINO
MPEPEKLRQHLNQRLSRKNADPAVRRTATTVLDELSRYFGEDHSRGARMVLASHLARFVSDFVEKENAAEALNWWTEFLLNIEDARPFTRSNWAHASAFEEVLSRCRIKLLDLKLEDTRPPLRLREALREVHNAARHAADDLLEVLYIGLRAKPAADRFSYMDLCQCMQAGLYGSNAFCNMEDQIIFYILDLEKSYTVDLLAGCFLSKCSEEASEDPGRVSSIPLARHHIQELLQELQEIVWGRKTALKTGFSLEAVQVLGQEVWIFFWELHGLYCLLSALLQRIEICFAAVQDYASFVSFLPVHQAALLDLERLLPQLQAGITQKIKALMAAYEVLPRPSAPPGRARFLEKCRSLLHQLRQTELPCKMATEALSAVTPQATLKQFHLWRDSDQCWRQFARLPLAARALLKPEELDKLKVHAMPKYLCEPTSPASHALDDPPDFRTIHLDEEVTADGMSLRSFVDEDTRLHQAVCKLALAGQSIGHNAWEGARHTAAFINDRAKHLFPHEKTHELAPVSCARFAELVDVFRKATGTPARLPYTNFQDMEWIVLDRQGKEVDTLSTSEFMSETAQTDWASEAEFSLSN